MTERCELLPASYLIAGEPQSGKSHFLLCACDAVIDVENRSQFILPKFPHKPRVATPKTWAQVVEAANTFIDDPEIRIIGLDTTRKLEIMAEREALDKYGWETLYTSKAGASKYTEVYTRLRNLIQTIKDSGRVCLMACHLKELYQENKPTGKFVPEHPHGIDRDVEFVLTRVPGPAWPSAAPVGIPPSAFFFRVDKDSLLWLPEQPPYVVAHVPRSRGAVREPLVDMLQQQLVTPAIEDAPYWSGLEKAARGVRE
jgi:hypothetical protein